MNHNPLGTLPSHMDAVGPSAVLALPQPCQEVPVVPTHNIVNPWAQAPGKSHPNRPSVPNCQETSLHFNFKDHPNQFQLGRNKSYGFLSKAIASTTCPNILGKHTQLCKHTRTSSLFPYITSKEINWLSKQGNAAQLWQHF